MSDPDLEDESYATQETRLRRKAWILAAVGFALIPFVYWLMVEVLLPRFWIEQGERPASVEVSTVVADL